MTTDPSAPVAEQLATALHEHMMGGGEAALAQTERLGLNLHDGTRDTLELLAVQQEALLTVLLARLSNEERERLLQAAAVFADGLTPARSMATRTWDGAALLRRFNAELQRQVERKTAELQTANETLRASEERFRTLSDTAPIGIFEADAAGQCTYTNQRWQQIYGLTLTESVGEGWVCGIHPEDRAQVVADWQAYIRNGEEFVREFRIVTLQGECRWVSTRARPVHGKDGTITGHIRTAEDITERKRSEAWLQGLINTTQDAVVSIDRQGHIARFNPAAERMFGYTQAEAIGQKVQLLMPEPYVSEHDSYVARYERTGEAHAIGRIRTVTAKRKNGDIFPIELSVTEVKVDGEVRYGAFIRDISDKVTLQQQIVEKERLAAVGMTAAKLAHEIGNPLNGMSLAAQMLELRLKDLREDETITRSVKTIQNQIMRLAGLLTEFRALSRSPRLTLQPTNLCDLVHDVLMAELPLYTQRGIAVEQRLAPDLPDVQVDQDKLKQVVLNLCKNAMEAMPDGGTLTVRVHNSGQHIHLEIADTGVGIVEDMNIFEPFVTTKCGGTGLGLPIVRQIVDLHGGTLTYTSTPGQGTTFVVALPLPPVVEGLQCTSV